MHGIESKQALDFCRREAERLRPLDEAHALYRVGWVSLTEMLQMTLYKPRNQSTCLTAIPTPTVSIVKLTAHLTDRQIEIVASTHLT